MPLSPLSRRRLTRGGLTAPAALELTASRHACAATNPEPVSKVHAMNRSHFFRVATLVAATAGLAACAGTPTAEAPQVDRSASTQALKKLPRKAGDLLDVVTVRKSVASDAVGVSGIGNLVGTMLTRKGRSTSYVPDVQLQQQRKESLDTALRAAIDQAVIELAGRFPSLSAAR